MRTAIDIRLTLNDAELSTVAVNAFHAHLPLDQYIKQQILGPSPQQQPVAPKPEAATAVVAPAAPENVADRLVTARTTTPEAPVEQPPPAAEQPPPPAAEPAPERPAAPAAQLRKRHILPAGLVPLGFEPVMELAERITAARKEVEDKVGTASGWAYNSAMSEWYKNNGLGEMPPHVRQYFLTLGLNAAAVREWYKSLPEGSIPENVHPNALLRLWQEIPAGTAPETTIVFERNRIRRVPISEVLGTPNGNAVATTAAPTEPVQPEPTFESFTNVDLNKLPDYDRRSLRRFTERIVSMGTEPQNLAGDKIAHIITALRGKNEKQHTPKIARALARLAVLHGTSGDYGIRREFLERFNDVRAWAAQPA